jgi:hypothetical protein
VDLLSRYTVVACLLDEIAFWPTDERPNGTEILNALWSAMATLPGALAGFPLPSR